MSADLLYEERIVIFIDILGFKQLIQSTLNKDGTENIERTKHVKHILSLPEKIFTDHPGLKTSKVVTQFSDSVVISFQYEEASQVFYTLLDILHLQLEFVNVGELVRGAVCFGKLHHNKQTIFGPGIVKAYEFETQSAIYPRIVIEPEVFEVGEKYAIDGHTPEIEREHIDNLILKDFDGHFFVDYFEKAQGELDDPNMQWPDYLTSLREIILKGLQNTSPGVRNKYLWMREKYNTLIIKYKEPVFLDSVSEILGFEFFDFYNELEPIEE